MINKKISTFVLVASFLATSSICNSQDRTKRRRGKVAYGTLVTPGMPIIQTEAPGQNPITSTGTGTSTGGNNNNTPPPTIDKEAIERNKRIQEIKVRYTDTLSKAQLSCIGIADTLEIIQGLAIGTATASGLGTLASGGALITQLVSDSKAGDKQHIKSGAETGLMVGSTVASTASTVTSAISIAKFEELINKIKDCNKQIKEIKLIESEFVDAETPETDPLLYQISEITSKCGDISENDMESIKGQLIGSTVVSSLGAVSGVAGIVAQGIDASKNDNDKAKTGADITAKVATSVSSATSLAGSILGGTTIATVQENKTKAEDCEAVLMKY
jgi:hypothetical protein